MLDCAAVHAALLPFESCVRTSEGLRISTHCLYPSFGQVFVYIVGMGDGFIVHDGGGAVKEAWSHGAEPRAIAAASRMAASAFGCEVVLDQIRVSIPSIDWLWSAHVSVANATSDAARSAVGKSRVTKEESLIHRAKAAFDAAAWKPETRLEYKYAGRSGKVHTFDLAVQSGEKVALVDAVIAHPNSIASKYLAFSDTESGPGIYKYALYDGDLPAEDKSLLSNVADLINIRSIVGTDARFILQ